MNLCYAAKHGDMLECFRLAAGGFDVAAVDYDGRTPMVRWPHAHGEMAAHPCQERFLTSFPHHTTPHHVLLHLPRSPLIPFHGQHLAAVTGQDKVHLAAVTGQDKVVAFLLAHGAQVNAKDAFWRTPLQEAVAAGHWSTAEILRRSVRSPLLCLCSAIALPLLWHCSASALPLLYHCSAIALPFLCHCSAIALPLLCHCSASALPLLCLCSAIALPLLCHCSAIALPLLCLCSASALPLLCHFSARHLERQKCSAPWHLLCSAVPHLQCTLFATHVLALHFSVPFSFTPLLLPSFTTPLLSPPPPSSPLRPPLTPHIFPQPPGNDPAAQSPQAHVPPRLLHHNHRARLSLPLPPAFPVLQVSPIRALMRTQLVNPLRWN
ncbi:unnamed protein product [Closterium sp. Naga37s-1]|nr:unnamed protein product [Closterium sp. Naga37s-1]